MKTSLARTIRLPRALPLLAALALVFPLLAACGDSGDDDQAWKIGLSYIPNIQFAPFYVALEKGYYKDAGLDVSITNHSQDLFGALVAGDEDMIFAGGDEMLQARSPDIPIVYLAQIFTEYPVALIAPSSSAIQTPADLKGHSIGIPGEFGETYIGMLALLSGAGLTKDDVNVQVVGFTQVQALMSNQVESIIGYINNEPIQLTNSGMDVRTFPVADQQPLISNGLGALEKTLKDHPDQVKAAIAATLKGVDYTIAHPDEALEISKKYVEGLDDATNAANAMAVLQASLPLWKQGENPGAVNADDWNSMASFLQDQGQLNKPVDASQAFSNEYLP
jgi:NitT/TauT family transport system substrate-binding protein